MDEDVPQRATLGELKEVRRKKGLGSRPFLRSVMTNYLGSIF
jgi:hypothetical protein